MNAQRRPLFSVAWTPGRPRDGSRAGAEGFHQAMLAKAELNSAWAWSRRAKSLMQRKRTTDLKIPLMALYETAHHQG